MLSGISIVCFATAYAAAFALEITRLFFRAPIRLLVLVGFALAGLFTHTAYLSMRARGEFLGGELPLSSWYDWCLLVAWVLAAAYVAVTLRRPQTAAGIFMLPLVETLVGVAHLLRNAPPFPRSQATSFWGGVHGAALLFGTVVVMLGFVAGVMYLVQSYRLKHKLPPRPGLKLPSLEWLQHANERSLIVSSLLLAAGLLSGVVLNLINHANRRHAVDWLSPVVWTSGVLLAWLICALLFSWIYKPARRGRKVAYLVVASFLFLALELGIVLITRHASRAAPDQVGLQHQPEAQARKSGDKTPPRPSLACASGLYDFLRAEGRR